MLRTHLWSPPQLRIYMFPLFPGQYQNNFSKKFWKKGWHLENVIFRNLVVAVGALLLMKNILLEIHQHIEDYLMMKMEPKNKDSRYNNDNNHYTKHKQPILNNLLFSFKIIFDNFQFMWCKSATLLFCGNFDLCKFCCTTTTTTFLIINRSFYGHLDHLKI